MKSGELPAGRLTTLSAAADRLLSFYPQAQPPDPRTYLAGLVTIFQKYSIRAVAAAIDPARGLPSKLKFLPTLAEVNSFCEEFDRPATIERNHQAAIAAHIEDRRKREEEERRWPGPIFQRALAEARSAMSAPLPRPSLKSGDTVTWGDMEASNKRAHGPFEPGRQLQYDAR